jgi:hypothetical protein
MKRPARFDWKERLGEDAAELQDQRDRHFEMPIGKTSFKRENRPGSGEIRNKVDATGASDACQRCYGILKKSKYCSCGRTPVGESIPSRFLRKESVHFHHESFRHLALFHEAMGPPSEALFPECESA